MSDWKPSQGLFFLPLGGAGEIGMNLNLYCCDGRWLMVDLGVTFGDDSSPAADVVMPDIEYIETHRDSLLGLVLTHAHEDHMGAVPYLWPRLRCPVYATPFAATLLRAKLVEVGLEDDVEIIEIELSGRFGLGPFEIELITLTHSIPEPNALAIRTRHGVVLHTGDWKLDPDPLIGDVADEAALRQLGSEGVLAMICDSTNVLKDGESGSEATLRESLMDLVGRFEGCVAIASFASNVARLETIAKVAEANGRHAALIGRSLWRIYRAAYENGYLQDIPAFITEHDVGYLDRDKVLLVCTGSQGEPRAALSRIARGDHPNVELGVGDAVIFSSRIIPGNEKAIYRLHDDLARRGVVVVTEKDHPVHVSGHPARDELVRMYQWVRPHIAIPVHGEFRHLRAHAELARDCQIEKTMVVENGAVVRLAPAPAEIVDVAPSGRLVLDGDDVYPISSPVMRDRQRILYNGAAVATVLIDDAGEIVTDPQLSLRGLTPTIDGEDTADVVAAAIRTAIDQLTPTGRLDDGVVAESVRLAIRRKIRAASGKRPVTDVHLIRI